MALRAYIVAVVTVLACLSTTEAIKLLSVRSNNNKTLDMMSLDTDTKVWSVAHSNIGTWPAQTSQFSVAKCPMSTTMFVVVANDYGYKVDSNTTIIAYDTKANTVISTVTAKHGLLSQAVCMGSAQHVVGMWEHSKIPGADDDGFGDALVAINSQTGDLKKIGHHQWLFTGAQLGVGSRYYTTITQGMVKTLKYYLVAADINTGSYNQSAVSFFPYSVCSLGVAPNNNNDMYAVLQTPQYYLDGHNFTTQIFKVDPDNGMHMPVGMPLPEADMYGTNGAIVMTQDGMMYISHMQTGGFQANVYAVDMHSWEVTWTVKHTEDFSLAYDGLVMA